MKLIWAIFFNLVAVIFNIGVIVYFPERPNGWSTILLVVAGVVCMGFLLAAYGERAALQKLLKEQKKDSE